MNDFMIDLLGFERLVSGYFALGISVISWRQGMLVGPFSDVKIALFPCRW
jgi:hypothetical protein